MALDKAALKSAFEAILTFDPSTPVTYTGDYMATQWADAIDTYSQGAVDELSNAVVGATLTANKPALLSALKSLFNTVPTGSSDYRPTIDSAITAYWTGVTFASTLVPPDGQPGSGISNAVTTPGSGFNPENSWTSSPLFPTEDESADRLANAIDTATKATKTTIVYVTPPPASSPTTKVLSIS